MQAPYLYAQAGIILADTMPCPARYAYVNLLVIVLNAYIYGERRIIGIALGTSRVESHLVPRRRRSFLRETLRKIGVGYIQFSESYQVRLARLQHTIACFPVEAFVYHQRALV